MRPNGITIAYLLFTAILFSTCQKEVEVELPPVEDRLVVEGRIEPDAPPIVVLSKSQGYFEPTTQQEVLASYLTDADVYMRTDEGEEVQLEVICLSELPEEIVPIVLELSGFHPSFLGLVDFCVYTTTDKSFWGEPGKGYSLRVMLDERQYDAITTIPQPHAMDSLFFRHEGSYPELGLAWGHLSEPSGPGDFYRWQTRRINANQSGKPEDAFFLSAYGSAFSDELIDGLTLDLAFQRPDGVDDADEITGLYSVGDTIIVKFSTITEPAFRFLRSMEQQLVNQGNPFAAPANLPSNISNGALGLWVGYGASYDTLVCEP